MEGETRLVAALPAGPVPAIWKAIAGVMTSVAGVAKDRQQEHQKFYYTGHDDVTWALRPAFITHGVVQIVNVVSHERVEKRSRVQVEIRWVSTEDGSYVVVYSWGESSSGGNIDLQVGIAVSYAVKVAQLKTFMLLGGYNDAEAGDRPEPVQQQATKPAPEKQPAQPVSEETVEGIELEYMGAQAQSDLVKLRKSVEAIVGRASDAQYERLRKADEAAAQRIAERNQ